MAPAWRLRRAGAAIPALAGLALGVLAIGPGLAPGFVLSYDMVFVPDPPLARATFGLTGTLPRAVPSDAVVDLLSRAMPAEIVQKLFLLAIFVLACSGAAAVLRGRPLLARLAAGVLFAWNPFVAERLLIGQWALLLGYSGLPWLVVAFRPKPGRARAVADGQPGRGTAGGGTAFRQLAWRLLGRLALACVPAAVGGFSAMLISALVIIPVAVSRTWIRPGARVRRPLGPTAPEHAAAEQAAPDLAAPDLAAPERAAPERAAPERAARAWAWAAGIAGSLALIVVLSLPWLVPSLLRQVQTDPAGVNAFAARADTPFGSLGSLLALGGIWNAQVVPTGYAGLATAFPLLLTLAGLAHFALGCRREPFWRGLGAAAVIGLAIASAGLTTAGRAALRSLIAAWPGFAVFRDGQEFAAPLALAAAIGLGAAVTWAMRPGRAAAPAGGAAAPPSDAPVPAGGAAAHAGGARALSGAAATATALGVLASLAPVLLLPGLAWGGSGNLHAVRYPPSWLAARQAIDADPAPGSVLVLPWAAYRRYPWNDGRTALDPWPRLLRRQTIWNDAVRIGNLGLAPEDPEAGRLGPLIRSDTPLTGPLRSSGVRYVIIDGGGGAAALESRLPGAVPVRSGDGLIVYRLPPPSGGTAR